MSSQPSARPHRLRVTEVFLSLQGESRSAGFPTVFIRLTGCPLRCVYCDTRYAFKGGRTVETDALVAQVAGFGVRHVCVTGGEPLAQAAVLPLLTTLCGEGYEVSLETGGALDIRPVDPRVIKVMDLKTPSSGEVGRNLMDNVGHLAPRDQVKFVIHGRADYEWARETLARYRLAERCEVLVSPCWGRQSARELAEWVLEDRLPVRFQVQLHKVLWGEEPGR